MGSAMKIALLVLMTPWLLQLAWFAWVLRPSHIRRLMAEPESNFPE
jgi:hypothetical protein